MIALLRDWWDVELGIPLRALRFITRGFRATRGTGFSYDRQGLTPVVLTALTLTMIPQAMVFDLLFSHAPVVRVISLLLHTYAIIWMLAIAEGMQTQTHEVDDDNATFRFPLLRSICVPRTLILAVNVVEKRPRATMRFGLGRKGLLVELAAPVNATQPFIRRSTQRLFIGADNPQALANALRTH